MHRDLNATSSGCPPTVPPPALAAHTITDALRGAAAQDRPGSPPPALTFRPPMLDSPVSGLRRPNERPTALTVPTAPASGWVSADYALRAAAADIERARLREENRALRAALAQEVADGARANARCSALSEECEALRQRLRARVQDAHSLSATAAHPGGAWGRGDLPMAAADDDDGWLGCDESL